MIKEASVFAKILILRFPAEVSERPVISEAIKKFDLSFNILRAEVAPGVDGMLVLELRGHRRSFEEAVRFFRDKNIQVKTVGQEVRRNPKRCSHCGACTAVCPSGALWIKRPHMAVIFDQDKCMACEVCVTACPPRAMEVGRLARAAVS